VVPVVSEWAWCPHGGPELEELQSEFRNEYSDSWKWLAWPTDSCKDSKDWVEYFHDIISMKTKWNGLVTWKNFKNILPSSENKPLDSILVTVGSRRKGRVQSAEVGRVRWDVVISTFTKNKLCQTVTDDLAASKQPGTDAILKIHKSFYAALVKGDAAAVAAHLKGKDATMTESTTTGHKISTWQTVLTSEERKGLTTTNPIVVVEGDRAWLTCLETAWGEGSAKLVTQKFRKRGVDWMLVGHRTVPYGQVKAPTVDKSMLCDATGCVALFQSESLTYRGRADEEDNYQLT
jgi:hypothetical protein